MMSTTLYQTKEKLSHHWKKIVANKTDPHCATSIILDVPPISWTPIFKPLYGPVHSIHESLNLVSTILPFHQNKQTILLIDTLTRHLIANN
jgi:hypothetical protein